MDSWVLFRKDDGRIGVLPEKFSYSVKKDKVVCTVDGTLEDAIERAGLFEKTGH